MIENKSNEYTVTIPLPRYETLLDFETRVNVVVDRIIHEEFCSMESILRVLGTEEAIQKADELKEQSRIREEEVMKKYGNMDSEF